MNRKILITVMMVVALSSCYYDVEENLYGVCNTSNVGFSKTVTPMLNNYGCTNCHSGPNPEGGFPLDSYTGVKTKIDDGRLWGSINHLAGFAPMPHGAAKMNQCDINKIKAWMDAGAPNN